MAFDPFEDSTELSQPAELYEFRLGSDTTRYTSGEADVVVNGNLYLSRQIDRSSINDSRDIRQQELRVTLPASDTLAAKFISLVPDITMTLTVLRYQRPDVTEETSLLFKGRINGARFSKKGTFCELAARGLEAGLSRAVPRFTYQGLCNHVHYDAGCTLDRNSFVFIGNVINVLDDTITVQGVSANGADWTEGGYVQFGPDPGEGFRLVLAQAGDVLTLLLPFEQDVINSSVKVFAGCKHDLTTCQVKFSNELNYGGFAFVPELNPFTDGLDV